MAQAATAMTGSAPKKKAMVKPTIKRVVVEVQALGSKRQALAALSKVSNTTYYNYFRLGGILQRMYEEEWFDGSFRQYVGEYTTLSYRRAMYFMSIYEGVRSSGIGEKDIAGIPWSALKEVAPILTPKNAKKWMKAARDHTVQELTDMVRAAKAGTSSGNPEQDPSTESVTKTVTFKLKEDQKELLDEAIKKAKDESSTEYDSVALEVIVASYLQGPIKKKAPNAASFLKQIGLDRTLTAFEKAFPSVNLTVQES